MTILDKMVKMAIIFFLPVFLMIPQQVYSNTITDEWISDGYIGADAHGRGDVVGYSSQFDISGANVNLQNGILTVEIYTNFAGRGDDGLYASYTVGGTGIGYGDLFLSGQWTPNGSSPYYNDTAAYGTHWQYGFSLDNRWGTPSPSAHGSGTLYAMSPGSGLSNNPGALLSDDYIIKGIFRDGQAVAVDTSSTNNSTVPTGFAEWWVDESLKMIGFKIDISQTSLVDSSQIALHWGQTCGNDVIEGSVHATPIPPSFLLLGTGLLGLAGAKKRQKK